MPRNINILKYLLSLAMFSSLPITLSVIRNIPIHKRRAVISILMAFLTSLGAKRITNKAIIQDSIGNAESTASFVSSVFTVSSTADECKLGYKWSSYFNFKFILIFLPTHYRTSLLLLNNL